MPSLMTCSLIYQLFMTPEFRRHLRPLHSKKDKVKGENREEYCININNIYELKQQLQQEKLQKDCLQKILNKPQHKRRRWVLFCNLITVLKQIKLTNPTFDIQQQQQQQQQLKYCQKNQQTHQFLQQQQQQQKYLLKI